jgi:DNA-binding transcriptional LysR family regulator
VSDLTDFLLARIAEDEAVARAVPSGQYRVSANPGVGQLAVDRATDQFARWNPARVLAECQAKRRVVEEWRDGIAEFARDVVDGRHADWRSDGYERAIYWLATAYADHPDYRDEWRA